MTLLVYIDSTLLLYLDAEQAGGPIHFYNFGEPYYEFTNFYMGNEDIIIDGQPWRTSEHYFQAQKFIGTPYVEGIRDLYRPREAFEFSRRPEVARWRRKDWEKVKQDIMYKALLAKFSQNPDLRKKLVGTGSRELVEHSPHDSYWGDGPNGRGKNHLGGLLMKIRELIPTDSGGPVGQISGNIDRGT